MGLLLILSFIICFFISVRLFLYRTALIYRLREWGHWIDDRIHVHQSLKVPELNDDNQENHFYRKVYVYLNSVSTLEDSDFTNLISGTKQNGVVLCIDDDQVIHDSFLGARVSWTNKVEKTIDVCKKAFVLKLKKKDKRRILQLYIQHIYRAVEDIEIRCKELKLYMNNVPVPPSDYHRWTSVRLSHPATIDTLAIDPDLKKKVKSDLDSFLKSKQYYNKLGRVWKRSYLLYGPSGTGKSSFIAAMAKLLNYDIYDIDLTRVVDDSDLNKMLLQTGTRSLIVVEDLDRFIASRSSTAVSLTGILNFMDGILNSCCGNEKVMVFTMNSKERIDPAVLRPGRIDVHIYFPLCNFDSFKALANNCLGIKDHKLFPQVEEILLSGATMSPAEMSELMISNRGSPGRALKSVITALQSNGESRLSTSGIRMHHGVFAAEDTSPEAESVFVMDSNCNVPVVKEIQKLYGLLRLKSSKKIGPSDQFSGSMERSR